jgi:hypothetical protein
MTRGTEEYVGLVSEDSFRVVDDIPLGVYPAKTLSPSPDPRTESCAHDAQICIVEVGILNLVV